MHVMCKWTNCRGQEWLIKSKRREKSYSEKERRSFIIGNNTEEKLLFISHEESIDECT